jgi:ectoine hydroxylase-related dioxygenase (phytanoyl-CoA dioxygenase family)
MSSSSSETLSRNIAALDRYGFVVLRRIISESQREDVAAALASENFSARNLLNHTWCKSLAIRLKETLQREGFLAADAVAVQCTLFDKTVENAWKVPYHQDLSIPVREKVIGATNSSWSEKERVLYTQPPTSILGELIAARVHLDDCGFDNGPLRVLSGSHRYGKIPERDYPGMRASLSETVCTVKAGDLILMRPLILHASSKPQFPSSRRVLHFVYGPQQLPFGLNWHQQI